MTSLSSKIHVLLFFGLLVGLSSLACGGGGNPPPQPTSTPIPESYIINKDTYWYVGALGSCTKMAKSGKTIKSSIRVVGTGKKADCKNEKDLNDLSIGAVLIEVKRPSALDASGGWIWIPETALK